MKELEIKILWENQDSFQMQAKEEGGDWLTVVMINENSTIKSIWGQIDTICRNYFNHHLEEIGKEMKV